MRDTQTEARERPTADLLRELSEQTTTLVRKEIELARVELAEKGKRAGTGAGLFGGAALLAAFAFGAVTACLILALATAVNRRLGASLAGVGDAALAGAVAPA